MRPTFQRPIRGKLLLATLAVLFALAATARAGQPTANFTWTPASPTSGNEISFTDLSTEQPISWQWTFGDVTGGLLNTSTAQNPVFTYNLPGTYAVTLTANNNDGSSTTTRALTVSDGSTALCHEDDFTLCINGARFAVSADWTKPDGTHGSGHAIQLTNDSGYFWFFDAANIEIVIKVLNGCAIQPPAYWVFAAGLTNVQVVLNAKDMQTGVIYTSTNPQGVPFVPIQATNAFPGSCVQ
jgi:PKD repeat protein